SKRWRSGSSGRHQNESLRWRRRRGGGIHFNADAHHETAIIKDRIERNDDKIEAFFDSIGQSRRFGGLRVMSASLIGRLRSSAFRLPTGAVSMSPTGSCFSSESAPRPFHHGIRGRSGTIFATALPSS